MVAMRVVNNVEREIMKAEYENWLLDENLRCKQVQSMLLRDSQANISPSKKTKGGKSQKVLDTREQDKKQRLEDLRKWQEDYCGSCKMEQELLSKGSVHIEFG